MNKIKNVVRDRIFSQHTNGNRILWGDQTRRKRDKICKYYEYDEIVS